MTIPDFDKDGNLSPGIHWTLWEEFIQRFGWNAYRQKLIEKLKTALDVLKVANCETVYVDGSFVTAKNLPGDYDCCWDTYGVDLNKVDPILLMLDDRTILKAKYGGDIFPAGIKEARSGLVFLEFFQVDKQTGNKKGIIALDLRSLP